MTKMNAARRGFLKMLPAMPVAAPSIVKEMATRVGGVGENSAYHSGYAGMPMFADDPHWLSKHRKRLEAEARGEFDEDSVLGQAPPDMRMVDAFHFDGLRSVSPVNRARMHAEMQFERSKRQRMSWAQKELQNFLKAHGLFA